MRATVLLGSVLALGVAGAVFAALPATAPPVPPKPPEVARAADPNADEKQPAEKGTAFGAPRLARAFDEPIAQLHAMVWNAKGTHLALQGFEDPKKMSFTRVSLFPLDATAVPISGTRWGAEVLVAVTPDGTGAVTLLRESQLISGNHRLTFLAPKAIGGFGGGPMGIAGLEATRTVKLEPSSAQDHAFAPDLKSFRMLVPVERADAEKRSWDVMEVSAETGEVGKRLLELPDGEIVLSPDGRRAALLGEPVKGVTVSDVGAGKTLFDAGLPPPGDPTNSHGVSRMAFSRDGGVLVVSLGRGSSVVLDVPTGRRRPALEGADLFKLHPSGGSFSPDGRLLACVAQRYKTEEFTDKGNDGRSVQRKRYATNGAVLVVWDTTTGKLVKLWPAEGLFGVAFNPVRPLLAVAESNGTTGTRVGFWDFAAEVKK